MTLPNIEHATITVNSWNRIIIQMDQGWVYWDRNHLGTDDEGNFITPNSPEEITYFQYGVYSPDTDFNARIVVVEQNNKN